tara:strand:- start:31 stop:474 length:444 start_codon:yes stop_codon:yes gene_type:complete
MKVILLKNIAKLGNKFDVKEVSRGFAQNKLIPNREATLATPAALKNIENQRAQLDAQKKIREDLIIKNIEDIKGTKITIQGKANDKGHLFAGIHKEEIIPALKEQTRLDIDEDHLVLEEALKEIGEHKIGMKVGDMEAEFTVEIIAE